MVRYTGLGSLPGTDFAGALRMTFDETPDFAYLPELPARGPWAGMIGRGLGLSSGLPAEFAAGEWRLTDAAGSDQRKARGLWRSDLDQLEENAQGFAGGFKVAVAGPWTLAAALGVAHTGRVLADSGARRDLAQSMAEGAAELLADLGRRLPQAELVLQVDEPSLPSVAAGAVPTPGGFFRHRAIDLPEIVGGLAALVEQAHRVGASAVLHSCAAWEGPGGAWPLPQLLGRVSGAAGFDAISIDLDQLGDPDFEAIAESLDSGSGLYLGVLPTLSEPRPLSVDALRRRVLRVLERTGLPDPAQLVMTPSCGLAGWTGPEVRSGLRALRQATSQVEEELRTT